ncbi:hypothetical protein QQP08_025996 [Theobroma cacao]|nr:hypothetical protein QQP08_025996 [Theobroma cacao]
MKVLVCSPPTRKTLTKCPVNTVALYHITRRNCDENGRLEITCNEEGVLFIEAETASVMDDLIQDFRDSSEVSQLVPIVDYSGGISSCPLLLLLVAQFKCGGVCLGVGFQHTLGDGLSALHFINSWADTTRGLAPSITPHNDRTLLQARVPPTPTFHHVEYDPPPYLNNSASTSEYQSHLKPSAVSIFKLTVDQLNTLKAKPNENGDSTKYSTYKILPAHLWRCASKVRGLSDDQETKLSIPVDGRSRLHPPLPPGYFGNAILLATPIVLAGDLQLEPLIDTVKRIHELISNTDFGWGRPIYMRPAKISQEGKICILPSPTGDGSLFLATCLEASHIELFAKLLNREEMKTTINGSTMVRPARDTPNRRLWNSNLDLVISRYHVTSVCFYKSDASSKFFDTQLLKESLSNILVPFSPMAGRLGYDENGRLEIVCNAEGVLFIEAETATTIDDLGDFAPRSKLGQLVPTVDYSGDISSFPLVLLQVTSFKHGGVCLGAAFQHTLVDARSVIYFMKSWSNITRGLPINVTPFIDRTLLRGRLPPAPAFHHVEYDPSPPLNTSISTPNCQAGPKPSSTSIFKITADQLKTLESKATMNCNTTKANRSTYYVLTAHIWRCVCKRGASRMIK